MTAGRDMVGQGRGRGKVILIGEHAAVHGHAVLAGALDRAVTLHARPRPGPLSLSIPDWAVEVQADDDHPVAEALRAVAEALEVRAGVEVVGGTDLPPSAGLGSSAATAVALTRALAGLTGRALDDQQVAAIADRAERCFHGNPSGVDVALAANGGFGLYRRGHGLTPIAAPPLRLAIGLSGQPRTTASMVERVAQARAERPAATDADLTALGAAAERAAQLLAAPQPDLAGLGAILADGHARLARLGVSTPELDQMVAEARVAGALGAKLTGAGGGGAVIALAPDGEDAVIAAWRRLGRDGFTALIGERDAARDHREGGA